MNKIAKREGGFTIIEVVLVLAIAGLIFLIVFLAVPALQRSQRDTQRRNDASRFMSQLSNYQANNKGAIPANAAVDTFVAAYLDNGAGSPDNWKDPSSGAVYVDVAPASTPANPGEYRYQINTTCNGENPTAGGGNRKATIQMKLEGSGFMCLSN